MGRAGIGAQFGCGGRSLPAWQARSDLLDEPQIAVGIVEGTERPVAGALWVGTGLPCFGGERRPVPHVKHVDATLDEIVMGHLDVRNNKRALNRARSGRWESPAEGDRGSRSRGRVPDEADPLHRRHVVVEPPTQSVLGGWLPGSAHVSSTASLEGGTRWGKGAGLARYTRNAVQIGFAAGAAIVLGELISPQRFYWAVIATFITFMGANNAGEQIRKAVFRVGGTVIGIGVGSLLVSAAGHHTLWSIAIILVFLFLGLYLFRISYDFLAIAITVTVSQLYQQLGEFTNSLLVVRLEETALGAAVAIVVVMLVLPLHTRQVLRVAVREHIEAVGRLTDHATARLVGPADGIDSTLRSDARAVDATYQAVVATAQPVGRTVWGSADEDTMQALRLTSASRNYSRNLVVDTGRLPPAGASTHLDMTRASATLHHSIEVVARALTGPRDGSYTRSSSSIKPSGVSMCVRIDPLPLSSPSVTSSSSMARWLAWPSSSVSKSLMTTRLAVPRKRESRINRPGHQTKAV